MDLETDLMGKNEITVEEVLNPEDDLLLQDALQFNHSNSANADDSDAVSFIDQEAYSEAKISFDGKQDTAKNEDGSEQFCDDFYEGQLGSLHDFEEEMNIEEPSVSCNSTMASPVKSQEIENYPFREEFVRVLVFEDYSEEESNPMANEEEHQELPIEEEHQELPVKGRKDPYDILDQIKRALNDDFELEPNISKRSTIKKKGRPEEIKDYSPETLNRINDSFIKVLVKKATAVQRSDAKTTTILREIKKYACYGLQKISSKCQYKDKKICVYNRAYLMCFKNHFCKSLNIPRGKISPSLYLEYVALKYPKNKVEGILKALEEQSVLSAEILKIRRLCQIRTAASKKSFCEYFGTSECYRLVWRKVAKMVKYVSSYFLHSSFSEVVISG
mgnify:CR=1 FL=1